MKFKIFYNDQMSGGGTVADSGVDPNVETQAAGEPGADVTKTGIFSGGIDDPATPGADPNIDRNTEPGTSIDYGFNQLESYESMPDYFNTLSNKFSELGLSQDQANVLVGLGDEILKPLIENYENQISEFSNEKWNERVEAEKAQFTPAEQQMAVRIEQQVKATFPDQADRDAFGALFSTRQDMALLQKFMSGLKPGADENAPNGGFAGQPKGKMTYNDYEAQYNKILLKGDIGTIEKEQAALDKLAAETGNKELLEYLKLNRV